MSAHQRWRKLGLIFSCDGQSESLYSHAAVPIAEPIDGSLYRIYFSSRDRTGRSHTNWITIDLEAPRNIVELSHKPVLSPGNLGEFDDSGTMATWLVDFKGQRYLYYIGWNLGVTVPFRNSIGLATAIGDGSFRRAFPGPIVDRTRLEPHFCASCCVIPSNNLWRMWYLSCTDWRIRDCKVEHRYHIKYAESSNGIDWAREGTVAIPYRNDNEYAISRPSVLRENDRWRMWFSCRGDRYRLGYAESEDGKKWERMDHLVGLGLSKHGWDSEMIEYPFVFEHRGTHYMLYNGNQYGRSGFGLAVLD